MTDIMNSPAVKQVMKQPGHVSADGAAQAQGEQPIRAAVVRAAVPRRRHQRRQGRFGRHHRIR